MAKALGPPQQRFQDEAWAATLRLLMQRGSRWSKAAYVLGTNRAESELRRRGLYDVDAQRFVEQFELTAIQSLTVRNAAQVQAALLEAVRRGDSVEQTKARLGKILDAGEARLRLIARTETNRAANGGRFAGWVRSGLVQRKEALATLDDRVRPSHLEAHGEVVGLLEPFTRGAAAGLQAPPWEPNCRCTIAPITRFSGVGRDATEAADDAAAGRAFAEDLGLGIDTHGCPQHRGGRLQMARPPDAIPGTRRMEDTHASDLVAAYRAWRRRLEDLVDEASRESPR